MSTNIMKLDENNRLKAIARCPSYIKDHEKIIKLFNKINNRPQPSQSLQESFEKHIENLCKKWHIRIPILSSMESNNKFQRYIHHLHKREAIIEPIEDSPNALLSSSDIKSLRTGKTYVLLQIDLTKSCEELERAFKEKIKTCKARSVLAETRKLKKTEYDPWMVYDLRQIPLGWVEISRKLYTARETKDADDTGRQAAKRAYNQALRMIKAVDREYNTQRRSNKAVPR